MKTCFDYKLIKSILENGTFYREYQTDSFENKLSYNQLSKLAVLSCPKTAVTPDLFEGNGVNLDTIHFMNEAERPKNSEIVRFLHADNSMPVFFVYAIRKVY